MSGSFEHACHERGVEREKDTYIGLKVWGGSVGGFSRRVQEEGSVGGFSRRVQ